MSVMPAIFTCPSCRQLSFFAVVVVFAKTHCKTGLFKKKKNLVELKSIVQSLSLISYRHKEGETDTLHTQTQTQTKTPTHTHTHTHTHTYTHTHTHTHTHTQNNNKQTPS